MAALVHPKAVFFIDYFLFLQKSVDLYQITITMTPAAKIRFVKNRIEDRISISPKGPVVLPVVDISTKSFNFSAKDQYSILKKLQEDGFIKDLCPLEGNDVWFEITGKPLDPFGLIAMNAGKTKNSKTVNKPILLTKDLKREVAVGDLALYSDGSIRYKDTIIPLRGQIKDLCRMFMEHPKRLLTKDDIKENIIAADKRKSISKSTISKYVSSLRNSLKVHFKKDVIFSQKQEGWYLDVTKT